MQIYHYHNDHLGTPNELTNQKGEVVWLADYEAWGNTAKVIWREEKLEQLQVSSEELQPIRFQGQSFDTETGLHYNRFRYFDPDMGMFTTRDPIGLMGGSNVFAYAPNPTGWIDPFGLERINVGTKKEVLKENNDFFGSPTCEYCGVDTIRPQKSMRGVTPPSNEWQFDHIEPDINGGSNKADNVQLLCRKCNRDFSDSEKPNYKEINRADYANSENNKP